MAAAVKRMELPWCEPMDPTELETWYGENIQNGTEEFDTDCRRAVVEVLTYVQRFCSPNGLLFDVSRVVTGGSLGKGTMIKGLSDVDLVAFISPSHLRSIVELGPAVYRQKLAGIIRDLEAALQRLSFVKGVTSNAFLVNFTISNLGRKKRSLRVDLLPTADNCYGHGRAHADMFRAMLQLPNGYDREFYSASLAEHQLQFFGSKPGHVKALIRLVKYWAYTCLPKELQKSYPLELITIYRWENAGKPERISKAQGLKDVLQVLTNLRGLQHYWTYLYDAALAKQAITQLGYLNPIVLDPANPTKNVCEVYKEGNNIKKIENVAHETLKSNLLKDVVVSANWSQEPLCLSPDKLEEWYNNSLQEGTGSFNAYCRMAIDDVVTSIHRICSSNTVPFDVDRVVKSGSLGKGTVVKDLSDVDLVAFVNPPHLQPIIDIPPDEYKKQLGNILEDMETALGQLSNVTAIKKKRCLIKFKLMNIGPGQGSVSIDLMTTADCHLDDQDNVKKLFDAMLIQQPGDRLYYSPAVIENQLAFVKGQPTAVKALIRLVKYWSYDFLPKVLQGSYKLELITIHCWESAGRPLRLDKAQGLRAVMLMLSNLSQLRVYWTLHYDATRAEDVITRFRMQKPIVLDPSEPTDNVCSLFTEGDNMRLMRSAAQSALQSRLLQGVQVRQGWN